MLVASAPLQPLRGARAVRFLGPGQAADHGAQPRPGLGAAGPAEIRDQGGHRGPYGLFSTAARSRNRVVMIGAGIGITPIRALLERTPFEPGDATVILRGHSEAELYLGDEILELCRRRGATLFHLTGAPDRRRAKLAAGIGSPFRTPAGQLRPGHRRRRRVYLRPGRLGAQCDQRSPRGRCPRRTTPQRKVRLVRIRAAVSAALASAGILLAGWQSGAHVAETGSTAAATSAATSSGSASGTAGSANGSVRSVPQRIHGSTGSSDGRQRRGRGAGRRNLCRQCGPDPFRHRPGADHREGRCDHGCHRAPADRRRPQVGANQQPGRSAAAGRGHQGPVRPGADHQRRHRHQ